MESHRRPFVAEARLHAYSLTSSSLALTRLEGDSLTHIILIREAVWMYKEAWAGRQRPGIDAVSV